MKDPSVEPLSPEISALLEREKNAYPEHEGLKSAVLARVEMSIALRPPPGGDGGGGASSGHGATGANAAASTLKGAATSRLVGVAVAAFLAGGVVGGAAMRATARSGSGAPPGSSSAAEIAGPAPTVPSAPAAPAASIPTMDVDDLERAAPSAMRASGASGTSGGSNAMAKGTGDLTHEREIIDVARAALARGRPDDALAAVERHAQRWPQGYLAEEREVVRIQALVAEGRSHEATQRAAQFHELFPSSVLTPAVDAAISTDAGARPR